MYATELDGQKLTLGVSGMLWNRSLIMYDEETKSHWSHILGECMEGKLQGKQLEQIPSVMMDWQGWSEQHPKGSVALLSRTAREYRREFYSRPGRFVLGIAEVEKAKAWSIEHLLEQPVINDTWNGQPVVVFFDKGSTSARLFSRTLGSQQLTFEFADGKITDEETGSTWLPVTGRAANGPLAEKSLKALPAFMSFRSTWQTFHPKTEMVSPERE